MAKTKVHFHQDNTREHTYAIAKLCQVVFHPPYSQDLDPTDYFLFAELKKKLNGIRFNFINEIVSPSKC